VSKRYSTISLPPAVVADANVVLSALIGGRARLVIASAHGPRCVAAEAVAEEVARHLPRLAAKPQAGSARVVAG
jgi:creatinine amidohydrolase/Fe(II)-dependent formamide hydrolase-like protein